MAFQGCLKIPMLWDVGNTMEISFTNLPNRMDAIQILKTEEAQTHYWMTLAGEYQRQGLIEDAVAILEASITLSNANYENGLDDLKQGKEHLFNHFQSLGEREPDWNKRETLLIKASKFNAEPDRGLKRRPCDDYSLLGSPYKRERHSGFN